MVVPKPPPYQLMKIVYLEGFMHMYVLYDKESGDNLVSDENELFANLKG